MKKEHRLLKNEDFKKVLNKKRSFANSSFVLYGCDNSLDHIRIGISVSKKLGGAVFRVKTRRQVRMMCQDLFDTELTKDFVIILRKGYIEKTYQENLNELNYLYLKILKKGDCR